MYHHGIINLEDILTSPRRVTTLNVRRWITSRYFLYEHLTSEVTLQNNRSIKYMYIGNIYVKID